MKATWVRPSPGRASVTTAGDPVRIAPVGKVPLTCKPATLAAVMSVSAGLKKRRRGPPAYMGQWVAAAGHAARRPARAKAAERISVARGMAFSVLPPRARPQAPFPTRAHAKRAVRTADTGRP